MPRCTERTAALDLMFKSNGQREIATFKQWAENRKKERGLDGFEGIALKIIDRLSTELEQMRAERDNANQAMNHALAQSGAEATEATQPYTGPARSGIEAQHGINDVFPGDPMPASGWSSNGADPTLAALRAAERAIENCHNFRSHNHFRELNYVREAIKKLEANT